jgi:transcriptional regulator with XRE-family HTH domain
MSQVLIPEGYGRNLANARQVLCLSQKDVGRLVGVSRASIGNYETEERYPNAKTRFKLHKELSVNPITLALPSAEVEL